MRVFELELRNLRRSSIIRTLSVAGVILAMLAFFPSMQTESMQALAGAKLDAIDPAVLAAFGLTKMVDFTIITNYFGYVLQYIALAVMVLVTQQATGLFIKEETDGTIEFLCAKPVSRSEIFFQKILAHLAVLFGMLLLCAIVTVIGYVSVSDFTFVQALKEAAILYAGVFYVALVFTAVGILCSTLLKSGRGISGLTIAIVFGTFIFGVMSLVVKQLDFLVWFSPLEWIKSQKLLTDGILLKEWIIGCSVIGGCTLAAWIRYLKKDLLIL